MIENEVSIGGCTARKRYGGLFREESLFSQREWLYLQKIGSKGGIIPPFEVVKETQ